MVAAFLHVHRHRRAVQPLDDDHVLDRRRALERLVGHLLQRHHLAAAPAAVGGDEQRGLRVVDAVAQRLGAEAAEHHRVHGADARAGQHGDRQLGHQRQVERHAVARLHAERLQDVGELADLAVEIEVGQRAAVARLAFPDDRGLVAPRAAHVAVDAVDAGVERAADEPLRVRRLPLEHLRPGREPLELARRSRPRSLRDRARRARRRLRRRHVRLRRETRPDGGKRRSSCSRSESSAGAFGSAMSVDQDTWQAGRTSGGQSEALPDGSARYRRPATCVLRRQRRRTQLPPSAGGTSLRKNIAPSRPPIAAKIEPPTSWRKKTEHVADRRRRPPMLSSTSRASGGMSRGVAQDLLDHRLLERADHQRRSASDDRQPDERADDAGQRADERALARRRSARGCSAGLQIGGQRAARHDPQAAAAVGRRRRSAAPTARR